MRAPLIAGAVEAGRSGAARRLLGGVLAAVIGLCLLVMLPLVLLSAVVSKAEQSCLQDTAPGASAQFPSGSGSWTATSYGPPWTDGNGSGETAAGVDLRPAKPAYLIAADPSAIPLRSYVHVWPNPFRRRNIAFYVGDTGSAIRGRRIDIYDWRGRTYQNAWGVRSVTVTPVSRPRAGTTLGPQERAATRPIAGTDADACAALGAQLGPVGKLGPTVRLFAPRHLVALPSFAAAPGFGPMSCDARIVPDVITLVRRYGIVLTACYGIHSEAGEHPLGAAADIVPADGDWSRTMRLARDLGWDESCAASGVAPACAHGPFRFIGYNGFASHGDPAHCPPTSGCPPHLHISWMTSASQGQPENAARTTYFPASWIEVFKTRGVHG